MKAFRSAPMTVKAKPWRTASRVARSGLQHQLSAVGSRILLAAARPTRDRGAKHYRPPP